LASSGTTTPCYWTLRVTDLSVSGDWVYAFGKAGDVFVTGDGNRDNKIEIGEVRNGNMWLPDASGNGTYGAGDITHVFGKERDVQVTGKWS